jgi:aspartate dehydrogenase
MSRTDPRGLRVAVAGLGAVGFEVVRRLAAGIEDLTLVAVSARDRQRAQARMAEVDAGVPVLTVGELAEAAEVVVECAPADVFPAIAEPALERGRILVPISVAALMDHLHLLDVAKRSGGRIVVPSGALLGLDAVRAAAEGAIHSVRMVTRKPPGGLAGAPYLQDRGIDLDGLKEPLQVFSGSARQGAAGFPANLNVAAALGLAGIGLDRTELEIWADPTVTRNCHRIVVESDSASFTLEIENIPTDANPRTGRLVANSVVAALKRLVSPLTIGT